MGRLTSSGYITSTLEQYKIAVQNIWQEAFGSDFQITDDTPQGNLINRIAELAYNNDIDGLNSYLQLSINTATGRMLDYIAFIRGITRKPGVNQEIICNFTSSSTPYTIFAQTEFKTLDTNFEYILEDNTIIDANNKDVKLVAKETGFQDINIGDKLKSDIYILNLLDIEIKEIIPGVNTETDEELRKRLQSYNTGFIGVIQTVLSELSQIVGVQKIGYLDNDTNQPDGSTGVPANSSEFLVVGGDDTKIAETILKFKNPTANVSGTTSITIPNYFGRDRIVKFTRPTVANITVKAEITRKDNQNAVNTRNYDQIKEDIVNYVNKLDIGSDVSYTTIYSIMGSYKDFDILLLTLQKNSESAVSENIEIGIREYAFTSKDKITLEVK